MKSGAAVFEQTVAAFPDSDFRTGTVSKRHSMEGGADVSPRRRTRIVLDGRQTSSEMRAFLDAIDRLSIVAITDRRGRIIEANELFCQLSGYSREELLGEDHRILNSGHHPKSFWKTMWKTVSRGDVWEGEVCNRAKDGSLYWVATSIAPLTGSDGTILGYCAVRTDITDRKKYEQQLVDAAERDKLTGLPNRASLQRHIQDSIDFAKHNRGYRFAVLFLDFDRFKLVNDSLGHAAGDILLSQIADRLCHAVRPTQTLDADGRGSMVARLGGDEFIVVLNALDDAHSVQQIVHQLLEQLDPAYPIGHQEIRSSASIGILEWELRYAQAEEMLRDADTAMYAAKERGKACAVRFDTSMQEAVQNRLQIENDMRIALRDSQFKLVYQPIVDFDDGKLCGVEALLRWEHPKAGLIPPTEFIPVAEEIGLIVPLSEWVFAEACEQLAVWKRDFGQRAPGYMSVNLSQRHLNCTTLVKTIKGLIDRYQLKRGELQLEITETALMQNINGSVDTMRLLRSEGVTIALDDFGTGYSSLSMLRELPVDTLKIDRAFTSCADSSSDLSALVHAVAVLAKNLGLSTIAEGIETPKQLVAVQEMGCRCGQGYLLGKPVCAEQLWSRIAGWSAMRLTTRGIESFTGDYRDQLQLIPVNEMGV